MRRSKAVSVQNNFSILALDDDPIMISTLQAYFQRSGYHVDIENDPYRAIERIRKTHYDILLLDFLMTPICGDQVVEEIRKFNKELFIILLTGHKSMAPPIRTIRELDIQGYYEKSDRFDQLELLVESCAKSIRQMRTIHSYQNGLSAIVDALPAVYQLQSLEQLGGTLLETAAGLLHASSGYLFLKQSDETPAMHPQKDPELFCTFECTITKEQARAQYTATVFPDQKTIVQQNKMSAPLFDTRHSMIGMLHLVLPHAPQYEQVQLLDIFSRQAVVAVHNIQLHGLVRSKNNELTQVLGKLRDSYVDIVSVVRLMVDARDIYTRGHSDRVSKFSRRIAETMKLDRETCERVSLGGLFHDIGKIGVPDYILLKPDKLTFEEYNVIKRHPDEGADILAATSFFRDIVEIVRQHHERVDGKGYPRGLTGDKIFVEAKIITVADCFDAMVSDRQYRKGLGVSAAVHQLQQGRGTQFMPEAVDAFLSLLDKEHGKEVLSLYDTLPSTI